MVNALAPLANAAVPAAFANVAGLPDIEFERHHTIMEGADRCDFCYRRSTPTPRPTPRPTPGGT